MNSQAALSFLLAFISIGLFYTLIVASIFLSNADNTLVLIKVIRQIERIIYFSLKLNLTIIWQPTITGNFMAIIDEYTISIMVSIQLQVAILLR